LWRDAACGEAAVDVSARTVRQAIAELDRRFPGIADRALRGGQLQPGLAVAVDGHVSPLGLLQPLEEDSELHFLPALGGG
jgi:molybdopterin synthase sulfur carrier subunit